MKPTEIRQMPKADIINRIAEEEENLINLRFQLASSQLTNTSKVAVVRRDIARLKTVLHEMNLAGEEK
jgi:large subunit ribosomal protein L29